MRQVCVRKRCDDDAYGEKKKDDNKEVGDEGVGPLHRDTVFPLLFP